MRQIALIRASKARRASGSHFKSDDSSRIWTPLKSELNRPATPRGYQIKTLSQPKRPGCPKCLTESKKTRVHTAYEALHSPGGNLDHRRPTPTCRLQPSENSLSESKKTTNSHTRNCRQITSCLRYGMLLVALQAKAAI